MDVESDPGLDPVTETFEVDISDISSSTALLSVAQADAESEASDSEKGLEAVSDPASSSAESDSSADSSSASLRAGHGVLLALSGLALLVLAVATFIMLRGRSK